MTATKKQRNELEHKIQSEFFDWVREQRNTDWRFGLICATPNQSATGKSHMYRISKMLKEGMAPGFPDISVLIPGKKPALFIELKVLGERKTPPPTNWKMQDNQIKWRERLNKAGFQSEVIYTNTWETVRDRVENWLKESII